MGMIVPNVATDSSDRTAFDSSIAVLSTGTTAPAGGPDAYLLNRSDFPQRELPQVTGTRDARYQTVFRQSVLDDIHAHGKSSMEAEVCGVLIGDVYSDRMATWAYIEHSIRGNNAVGKQTQVTITSETWTRIHDTLEKQYPGKKIIGWYHTHPGFGIFLSGMDLFIQDNFFNQPWQVATVYDPHAGDEGTFIWRGGKSEREAILVENDTGVSPHHADAMAAIEKLTNRVKHLERRIDVILTGFLFLVLIALIAPLVLFALGPDRMIRRLPQLQSGGTPASIPQKANSPTNQKDTPATVEPNPLGGSLTPPAAKVGIPALPKLESNDQDASGPPVFTPKKTPGH
jgi:proteasome lid subunit RPN8/RPN11